MENQVEKTRNLCAQIPVSLHMKVRQDPEAAGQTLGQFITELILKYYEYKENGGNRNMEASGTTKTLAFQIPGELKDRIDRYLAEESRRTGRKITLREFMMELIERALEEAERGQDASDPDCRERQTAG